MPGGQAPGAREDARVHLWALHQWTRDRVMALPVKQRAEEECGSYRPEEAGDSGPPERRGGGATHALLPLPL